MYAYIYTSWVCTCTCGWSSCAQMTFEVVSWELDHTNAHTCHVLCAANSLQNRMQFIRCSEPWERIIFITHCKQCAIIDDISPVSYAKSITENTNCVLCSNAWSVYAGSACLHKPLHSAPTGVLWIIALLCCLLYHTRERIVSHTHHLKQWTIIYDIY